jgi:hypothetical protein
LAGACQNHRSHLLASSLKEVLVGGTVDSAVRDLTLVLAVRFLMKGTLAEEEVSTIGQEVHLVTGLEEVSTTDKAEAGPDLGTQVVGAVLSLVDLEESRVTLSVISTRFPLPSL